MRDRRMEVDRGSQRLLLILPVALGGLLLALVATRRGADPGEGRPESPTPKAGRRAGALLREPGLRRLPSTPPDQLLETGKAPVRKGTPPADLLVIEGDPPLGDMTALWLDLNGVLEQKESTPPELHRQKVIRLTIQFLDLKEPEATAFLAAVSEALAQLASAQDDLHRSLDVLPADLPDEDRESMKRDIVELYDVRKRSAVTRVLATLGSGGLHPGFLEHLEMWMGYLTPL